MANIISKVSTTLSSLGNVVTGINDLTDYITGTKVNTEWRQKIIRNRLTNSTVFAQINPVKETARSIIQNIAQVVNTLSGAEETTSTLISSTQKKQKRASQEKQSNQTNFYSTRTPNRSTYGDFGGNAVERKGMSDNPYMEKDTQTGDSWNLLMEAGSITDFRTNLLTYQNKNAKKLSPRIYIINTSVSPYEYIELQTTPKNISFQPKTSWAVLNSLGRNTPLYHYTGAEDTVSFDVSWYCSDSSNLYEVLTKCKLLESWSKADGYSSAPPILQIFSPAAYGTGIFNTSDSEFGGTEYILWDAHYDLTNFGTDAYYQMTKKSRYSITDDIVQVPFNSNELSTYVEKEPRLLPITATQTLEFRRVSDHNLTHNNILNSSWKLRTKGIGYASYDTTTSTMVLGN